MASGAKDKIMSLFKTNSTKDYNKLTRGKNINANGKEPGKSKIKKPTRRQKPCKHLY